MPALGESVTEGTVTTWLKSVGDTVALDEPLVEVSTDKVDSEVPSPAAGVLLQILVAEDETVEVGTVLAVITAQDPSAAPSEPAAPAAPAARRHGKRMLAVVGDWVIVSMMRWSISGETVLRRA